MAQVKVESGLQLISRLNRKHDLKEFYSSLFETGLQYDEVVEIYGESNCCKSFFLADIVSDTILSSEYGGLDIGVLVFETDGNFNINNVKANLTHKLKNVYSLDDNRIDITVNNALNKLFVFKIFNVEQLYITIENLDTILIENPAISLIIFDTLTAFYWFEQQFKLVKMNIYVKNLLKIIQRITKNHNTPLFFTRPHYFESKMEISDHCIDSTSEIIATKIQICEIKTEVGPCFKVNKHSHNSHVLKYFKINNGQLTWLKELF